MNITIKGQESLRELAEQHKTSLIYIFEDAHIEHVMVLFKQFGRDFDFLDDSLGKF